MAMDKLAYSVVEAAGLLGIGRSAAYEAARTGQLPTIRIGKRILVPKSALDQLLEGVARGSTPPSDEAPAPVFPFERDGGQS